MLRVELKNARPGMVLALAVRNPKAPQKTLLRVGYALEPQSTARLLSMGVRSVWIRYPGLELLDKYVDPRLVQAQSEVLHDIAEGFEQTGKRAGAKMSFDQYARSINKLINSLVSNPQAAMFLGALEGEGGCVMRHSSSVAFLSLLMGLKLEGYLVQQRKHIDPMRAREVTNLGIGALLHDIGILQLDADVREKYEKTGDDSDPCFRKHTTLGYDIVRGNVEPTAATIVLNHHQRFDGSGYGGEQIGPLEGERIHVFPRIVGLADYFDEMQNPVAGGGPIPAVTVFNHLLNDDAARQMFDPRVLQTLLSVAPAYPPGSMLRLSDGRYAVAVENHPKEPCRPTVQIIQSYDEEPGDEPEMIDLTQDGSLDIVTCDGVDVSAENFSLPVQMRKDDLASMWSSSRLSA